MGTFITLTTDFGLSDGYVAAMKGVLLGINPAITLVDVTHEIAPQQIGDGAFVLHSVRPYFPDGTIHLVVVDPGVGTERAGVVVDMAGSYFVGPDNGLLSYLLWAAGTRGVPRRGDAGTRGRGESKSPLSLGEGQGQGLLRQVESAVPHDDRGEGYEASHKTPPYDSGKATAEGEVACRTVPLPARWRAVRITDSRYWLPNPSNTFHGRDVFAPVAAHLSMGIPMESFGPAHTTLQTFEIPGLRRLPDGVVEGCVIHVDRYGNLITNLRAADLPAGELSVEIGGHHIEGLSRSYGGHSGLIALVDGHGHLEIALPNGSAYRETGLGAGTVVRVTANMECGA